MDGSRIIFISFDPGSGGHRLGRVISCLPDVHWYSHKDNGIHPWNVHIKHTDIRQRQVSKYHYDRLVPNGSLPPLHDYVKDFIPDEDHYYKRFFYPRFEKMSGYEIMKKNRLVFCTHSTHKEILKRFPKAKVINIIGDEYRIADRYMETSALFPGYVKMKWLGGENTEYGRKLRTIANELGHDFKVRDIWAWDNHKKKYQEDMEWDYRMHIDKILHGKQSERESISREHEKQVHKHYMEKFYHWRRRRHWDSLKEFLNAKTTN